MTSQNQKRLGIRSCRTFAPVEFSTPVPAFLVSFASTPHHLSESYTVASALSMARRLPHHHTRRAQQEEEPAAQDTVLRAWIRTTYDALLVFEAARQGIVPRVTRRFHDAEKRSMIVSGAVLVFTEEESGIKRWTDPFMWSASRMLGNFVRRSCGSLGCASL